MFGDKGLLSYLCGIFISPKALFRVGGIRHTDIKRRYLRFGFDIHELRNFKDKSKTKQRERPLGCIVHKCKLMRIISCELYGVYIHFRGVFSVARFDLSGNAKAYGCGTSKSAGSTFFCVCM